MNERLKRDYETFENGRKRGVEETLEGAIPVEIHTAAASNLRAVAIRSDGEPWGAKLIKAYLVKRNPNDGGTP